jgi:hypothetical protein
LVWMPSRTGTHIGGTWVEVDDGGEAHSGSNIKTLRPSKADSNTSD